MHVWLVTAISLLSLSRAAADSLPADVPPVPAIAVGGYVETYYQLHVQNPDNRLTNLRGFDNRSRTFTLSNVALDVRGERGPISARIVLQIGHAPATYYTVEPASPGANGANASDGELWRYLQTATVTGRAPREITIEAGLFTSPIGLEITAVKDNWNWSRSNLFFGLPAYHAGITVARPVTTTWTGKLHVYNGWNNVVDNNGYPSAGASLGFSAGAVSGQLLYLGGVERATEAAEGAAWRHLFDAYGQVKLSDIVSVAAQLDAGFERNDIGTSRWFAAAGYTKLQLLASLYAAARVDYFYEHTDGAQPIFWPIEWIASATATFAYQPVDYVSVRFEYRHDHAAADAFFGDAVATDPMTMAYVPNRDAQDTVTAGVTAWF
ncbi:MAG TPA: outer membrane beta-barrel protein [Kofleriaceae bacterium]